MATSARVSGEGAASAARLTSQQQRRRTSSISMSEQAHPRGKQRTRPSSSSLGSSGGGGRQQQQIGEKGSLRERRTGGGKGGGRKENKTGRETTKPPAVKEAPLQQQPKKTVTEERVERLSNNWGELMFLLRKPIIDASVLSSTWQSAMNGVKFLQELTETANDLGVQQGTLSKWLLPFNNQTSLTDQAATAPPLGSSNLDGLMSHAQRRRLVSEAVSLRSLIRVKIADNADLEQALVSVQAIDKFMYRVKQTANEMKIEPYVLFQRL